MLGCTPGAEGGAESELGFNQRCLFGTERQEVSDRADSPAGRFELALFGLAHQSSSPSDDGIVGTQAALAGPDHLPGVARVFLRKTSAMTIASASRR
jgi:hypothetical protein